MSSINTPGTGVPSFPSEESQPTQGQPAKAKEGEHTIPVIKSDSSSELAKEKLPSSASTSSSSIGFGAEPDSPVTKRRDSIAANNFAQSQFDINNSKDEAANVQIPQPPPIRRLSTMERNEIIDQTLEKASFKTHQYGSNQETIEKTRRNDLHHLLIASNNVDGSRFDLSSQHAEVSKGCRALIQDNEKLFKEEGAFLKAWTDFTKSSHFKQLSELEQSNIAEKMASPDWYKTSRLDAKGYHNSGHAKEMFYDNYEALAEEGEQESTCMAGATKAYFHDLVQGLEKTFPTLGINEDVTAKFVNFLIDSNQNIKLEVKSFLTDLSEATIVGGTLLLQVTDGSKNAQGIPIVKNRTNSECCDALIPIKGSQALNSMRKIRASMAYHDISRTRGDMHNEGIKIQENVRPHLERIKLMKAKIGQEFPIVISDSAIARALYEKYGKNLTSRLFQSIRMQTEFGAPSDKYQLMALLDIGNDAAQAFINKIRTVWGGEAAFADRSDHKEYIEMLNDAQFKEIIHNASDNDIKQLIFVALGAGQDGSRMTEVSAFF